MRRSPALALAAALALSACEDLGPDIDPFPIPANRAAGGLTVALRAGIDAPVVALLDTNTPLTVLDRDLPADPDEDAVERHRTDVTVLEACRGDNPLAGCGNVDRARFMDVPVLATHPCDLAGTLCRVGLEPTDDQGQCDLEAAPANIGYGAILGSDLLSMAGLRLDLRDDDAPAVRLFPDIAGGRDYYCETGVAVMNTPFSGGATIRVQNTAVVYAGNRIPLNACADFSAQDDGQQSGSGLLLMLSTGIGPSVISQSAYERYYQQVTKFCDDSPTMCGDDPASVPYPIAYSELPGTCLWLPARPSVARVATLRRLSITGDSERPRGSCEERRAARIMNGPGECPSEAKCPCPNDESRCTADAVVELAPPDGITVAVLPDAHPLLQGLREELRPGLAEVDGLLGLDALHALTFDIDYPGARVLVDCDTDAAGVCTALTETRNKKGDSRLERCR